MAFRDEITEVMLENKRQELLKRRATAKHLLNAALSREVARHPVAQQDVKKTVDMAMQDTVQTMQRPDFQVRAMVVVVLGSDGKMVGGVNSFGATAGVLPYLMDFLKAEEKIALFEQEVCDCIACRLRDQLELTLMVDGGEDAPVPSVEVPNCRGRLS